MPVKVTFPKTPAGKEYMRALASGEVTAEEAHQVMDGLRSGQRHQDHGLVAVVEAGTNFSPEARKVFGLTDARRNEKKIPTAVVVHSAPLRVMMSFIFRMAGANQRARIFASELEAQNWVEQALS